VRLIKVADGSSLWAGTFDEKFTDVFAVEDRISQKVVEVLALRLSAEEQNRLTKRYPENTTAYQLYLMGDEAWMTDIIARTETAGYKAFCLTVDTQVHSRRERDVLKGWVSMSARGPDGKPLPPPAVTLQPSMDWKLVQRIKQRFKIPLVLKGIACAEDAELAVQHGVEVVYVSNHGGRQLDQARASLDTLPEVVRVARGRATIIFDGGILRGTDVLKALALGADAVGIGRLEALAMAAGGARAVVRMLELLEHEMRLNLALMGLSSIDQLTPDCVSPAEPVGQPHVLSGFPLLNEDY
jgi:glycolate oxidase